MKLHWSYLAPFLRYDELQAECRAFCLPDPSLSFNLTKLLSIFSDDVSVSSGRITLLMHEITFWLSQRMWSLSNVTNGQTDRQTTFSQQYHAMHVRVSCSKNKLKTTFYKKTQLATIPSLTLYVYLHSFTRGCLPKSTNRAKFWQNLTLQQFKVIQGHLSWCQSKAHVWLPISH